MEHGGSMPHPQGPSIHLWQQFPCISRLVGLGGLGVTWSPRDPRFAGSNPAELDGFFQEVKILSTSPPGDHLSWESRV